MFFRFASAMMLVVLISLAGVAIEKQNLALRREISRQHYRTDVLLEQHARLRLKTQQLGAPMRVIERLERGTLERPPAERSARTPSRRMPLLRWQRAAAHGH